MMDGLTKKDQMNKILKNDIFELESINMPSILEASGLVFLPAKLRESLETPQEVISIYRDKELVALLRYSVVELGIANVLSLQIRDSKKNKLYLHSLFKKILVSFTKNDVQSIISIVQKANVDSMNFHKKLGFKVDKEFEKAVRFTNQLENIRSLFS